MKKKLISLSIILIIVIGLILYVIFSSLAIKEYISKDMKTAFPDKFVDYRMVRCDFGINNIEYAFVGEYKDRIDNMKVFFYKMKRDLFVNINNWSDDYIGGTTIKNTTFSELVKMVKEDCSQFQKGKGDYYGKDLAWSYSPAPTDEENAKRMREKYLNYSANVREIFKKVYNMELNDFRSDEVMLEIYNRIEKEGLDSTVVEQIRLDEEEYQRKIDSGEIVRISPEEELREKGIEEKYIKEAVEQFGFKYVGPE